MPRGGKRPGAGRKKGSPSLLDKEAAREVLRALVKAKLQPMAEAQIANAMGVKYLVWRDKKTGKFKPVPEDSLEKLNEQGEVIEVWEEKPNVQAFTDLMNRTLDKPAETVNADVKGDVLYRITWKSSE